MIAVYTRHKLELSTFKLRQSIEEFCQVVIFSEENLKNDQIIDVSQFGGSSSSIDFFSTEEKMIIIQRCRVLRSIAKKKALKLISDKAFEIYNFISNHKIKVIVLPRVDNFFLDILVKVASKNSVVCIGVWQSAFLKDHSFITLSGEYNRFHATEKSLVARLNNKLKDKNFSGTSVRSTFSRLNWVKKFFYLYFRAVYLEFLRLINNQYSYRNLATRYHVAEYHVGLRSIFREYFVTVDKNLSKIGENKKPLFLIALQVNPESTIDYYCKDLAWLKIDEVVSELSNSAIKNGFQVAIKEHPNMDGFRPISFYTRLKALLGNHDIRFIDSRVTAREIMKKADIVFSWTGTVAVEAILMGKWSITADHPYLKEHPRHIQLQSVCKINDAFDKYFKNKTVHFLTADDDNILLERISESIFPEIVYFHSREYLKYKDSDLTLFVYYLKKIMEKSR